MKTKLYVLKATNDFDRENCLFSAYLDQGEALHALDVCQVWQMVGDDLFQSLWQIFDGVNFLDPHEILTLKDLVAKCPLGAPVFDSYGRKWLISLGQRLKRAPTRGSSGAFDWVV